MLVNDVGLVNDSWLSFSFQLAELVVLLKRENLLVVVLVTEGFLWASLVMFCGGVVVSVRKVRRELVNLRSLWWGSLKLLSIIFVYL